MKRERPKGPTAIRDLSGPKYRPIDKANANANCLKDQFTPHVICDGNHEPRVEVKVQAVLKEEDKNTFESVRPCNVQKLKDSLY